MAISLIDLSYDAAQDPVGVETSFTLTLSLLALGGDTSGSATVTFWTQAAYAVVPASVNVTLPPGTTTFKQEISIRLRGQPQPELVRVYAECDERHSVFVQIK